MSSPPGASELARLAAELQAEPDEQITARTVVDQLADLVPDAGSVSITVRVRQSHRTLASTGTIADEADALQYELGEGPCLDASDRATFVHSADVGVDERWPHWGPRARDVGVTSLLAVQLLRGDQPQGAVNLYGVDLDGFADDETQDLVAVYAVHAATAITAARSTTSLTTALSSRHTIGMAQGIAMERWGLDEQHSFELLRRMSQSGNMKLRDVADHLVRTRRLPGGTDAA